jgi:hypothetical protein
MIALPNAFPTCHPHPSTPLVTPPTLAVKLINCCSFIAIKPDGVQVRLRLNLSTEIMTDNRFIHQLSAIH